MAYDRTKNRNEVVAEAMTQNRGSFVGACNTGGRITHVRHGHASECMALVSSIVYGIANNDGPRGFGLLLGQEDARAFADGVDRFLDSVRTQVFTTYAQLHGDEVKALIAGRNDD